MSYVRPISINPEDFRQHAIPRLTRLARVEATFVALNENTFSSAFAALYCEASRLGAALLPRNVQNALEGWLYSALVREIEHAEQLVELNRRVGADIEAHRRAGGCGMTPMLRALEGEGAA